MSQDENQATNKKGLSKGLIITIVVALLVIGGGVAAYFSTNSTLSSDKGKYLLAEKNSLDFINDVFEERFESELAWAELTNDKPTETAFELSAEYNDPYGGGFGNDPLDPSEIINNSIITITAQTDVNEKKIAADIVADVAGFNFKDIEFYLTENELIVGLPFLNELLQVTSEGAEKLIQEAAPELADQDIDFGQFFDSLSNDFSEKYVEHIKKEYFEEILKDLSDDAFTSEKEKIDVHNESIDAEKLTLHLTEEEVKDLLITTFDKLQKDEVIKEMIKDQLANAFLGVNDVSLAFDNGAHDIINDFEDAMAEAKEEIKDFKIPDGLTSTVWVDDKLIVKRDFSLTMGPDQDDLVTFTIEGTQLFTDASQVFDYDLKYEDSYDNGVMNITGDLAWKDDQINDTIKLSVEDIEIVYEADETLNKGEREFDRSISLLDSTYDDGGTLLWSGSSNYEKDSMTSEHTFALEIDDFGADLFSLHATIDGKQIKEVVIPDGQIKDIGSMTIEEIEEYFSEDIAMQFQQWLMEEIMGAGGNFGF